MSNGDDSPAPGTSHVSMIEAPPTTVVGILRRLGPGLIIAGSIVGSGELIATTKTGAEAGFWLLWLILIGCVIKVFVQIELGRYTLTSGNTTMTGMAQVPGPRVPGHGNWLVWYWFFMFLVSLGQLGGIVGGVGQALAISAPLTETGRLFNQQLEAETQYKVAIAELPLARQQAKAGDESSREKIRELQRNTKILGPSIVKTRIEVARDQLRLSKQNAGGEADHEKQKLMEQLLQAAEAGDEQLQDKLPGLLASLNDFGKRQGYDDRLWATIVTVITAVILVLGRYGLIQSFATAMVASFTAITVVNLLMLQSHESWAIGWQQIVQGMSFRLPPLGEGDSNAAIGTALATFGIIGVAASELITYPYWCMEKGYARFTGPRNDTQEWAERARGWMRVMRWDAWCSMVVYTFATIAFYLLGAAILGRVHLNPAGTEMIRTLAVMYEPVFGPWAQWLFLFGAFAVLYSTFFVGNASYARVFPDALRVLGMAPQSEEGYRRRIRFFSGLFPFLCLTVYVLVPKPVLLVMIGGLTQAIMLPMIAGAALYFRYRRSDSRIAPGRIWDVLLWISAAGMLVAGAWAGFDKVAGFLKEMW